MSNKKIISIIGLVIAVPVTLYSLVLADYIMTGLGVLLLVVFIMNLIKGNKNPKSK